MNFSDLILHPKVRRTLTNYLQRPTHALLLSGDHGVGLGTIAKTLAKEIAGAGVVVIEPRLHDKQKTLSINVEDIRELRTLMRNRRSDPLCIVIDEIEKMTTNAPEAFLKALEEPSEHIFYILTTHMPTKLPLTIKSRAQIIEILPSPVDVCEKLLEMSPTKLTAAKHAQIMFLADRKPAEIARLLTDEEYFRTAASEMSTAKDFIQGTPAKRLGIIADITTRETAINLTKNIAKMLLLAAGRTKIAGNLNVISDTLEHLVQNGNVRAQLTYLALNI
ncbi:AAA family ATPase [Candidatus Saccharibacteria bacterium]|nr:AAA family ATPase [Candidatus Saccharibacteria bacterium]